MLDILIAIAPLPLGLTAALLGAVSLIRPAQWVRPILCSSSKAYRLRP